MSTTSLLRPGVSLRRGADLEAQGLLDAGDAARLTAAGERRLAAAEPSEVLIWEMHASLRPAASI
jgi:quercetin 2,3-dioxygenase